MPNGQVYSWCLCNGSMDGGDPLVWTAESDPPKTEDTAKGGPRGGPVAPERESCPGSRRNSLSLNSVSSHANPGQEQGSREG